MDRDDWLKHESLQQLATDLCEVVVDRYRISPADAARIIHDTFALNQQLRAAVLDGNSAARLKRNRAYKQAASDARRNVYYHLRTYRTDAAQLDELIGKLQQAGPNSPVENVEQTISAILQSHASTRERLPFQEEFYQRIFEVASPPTTIVDVGCGIHPLMFPWDSPWSEQITTYVALDHNTHDTACNQACAEFRNAEEKLIPLQWSISDGWRSPLQHTVDNSFDLALMMKVIPVVNRQQRELLPILCETPASHWLLTGSRVSMTKRRSIERREKRVMADFLRLANRSIKAEFVVGEEFVWLV